MDFSANHIGFVIASYALSFVCLAGLIIATLGRDRKLRAQAERLDTQRRKTRT
jgi:hypothetical protein